MADVLQQLSGKVPVRLELYKAHAATWECCLCVEDEGFGIPQAEHQEVAAAQ